MEEVFHANQIRQYGIEFCEQNQAWCELEAQDAMLELGEQEGWSAVEMQRIRDAKAKWQVEFDKQWNGGAQTGN